MIELDEWQQKILNTSGNICVRAGRQVGKSTIISIKAARYAIENPKKTIMVIASVERQAYLLFEKILNYLYDNHKPQIKMGTDRPTKHVIKLKNGSVIYSLPAGTSGQGIRGYTIDLLICDEAAFIGEDVYTAIVPALAITKGAIWLLSTPHGKEGYFYRVFSDESYTKFHVSSLECPRRDDKFLERERERMTKVQWAQEYLGEFVDELRQFFPNEVIKKCLTLQRVSSTSETDYSFPAGDLFCGVDVARQGEDESVLVSVAMRKDRLKMFDMEVTTKTYTTETTARILAADKKYRYKKIYIDDGGMGVAVFDPLLREPQTANKVVAINNNTRSLDPEKKRRKKLLKEDLYNNLLRLMEQEKIELFNEPEIELSLKSVQYEYADNGELKLFGNYTHIVEALIRAAWCAYEKPLNLWCY